MPRDRFFAGTINQMTFCYKVYTIIHKFNDFAIDYRENITDNNITPSHCYVVYMLANT